MSRTITPGGRVGDDRSIGSASNGMNWVEREGGMPRYMRIVRNGLMKEGMTKGKATALAVAAIERWKRGGDNVSPKVQAAAAAAWAEWEKMKASANSKGFDLDMELKAWNEEAHPRGDEGTPQGGRFVAKDKDKAKDEDDDAPRKDRGKKGVQKHKVEDGDTLKSLAETYGTTIDDLLKLNPDLKKTGKDRIDAGDTIQVPFQSDQEGYDENGEDRDTDEERAKLRKERLKEQDEDKPKPRVPKKSTPSRSRKSDYAVSDAEFKGLDPDTLLATIHDQIDQTTETKDAAMQMEFKTVGVNGLQIEDEVKGIVTTFVSVTGLQDNVKDVIHPGAYAKSLNTRTPKGVWSHSWDTPVSKTLEVAELLPGSQELPKSLPNGQPWPKGAGALKVKTQFNLDTQRGREAYSDVTFFGDEQEWSIGYQVPVGGARIDSKTGVRHIDYLELYEYSPVLFGAMSAARTESPAMAGAGVKSYVEFDSVRDAQEAYRSITMDTSEFKDWANDLGIEVKGFDLSGVIEVKGMAKNGICTCNDIDCDKKHEEKADDLGEEGAEYKARQRRPDRDTADESEDESEDWSDDEEDEPEEKAAAWYAPTAFEYDALVNAHKTIEAVLAAADAQFKSDEDFEETKGLSDIIEKHLDALGDVAEEMKDAAEAFDTAYDLDDTEGMNEFGNDVLEVLEKAIDDALDAEDKAAQAALHKVAAAVASMAPQDEDDLDTPEEDEDEDDMTRKGKQSIPPRPGKKDINDNMEEKTVMTLQELNDLRVGFAPRRR